MKAAKKAVVRFMMAAVLLTGLSDTASAAGVPAADKSLAITVGEKKTIKVEGSNIKSKVFKSTNSKIATVSKKGVVTAKTVGSRKVKITVKYLKNKTSKKVTKKVLTTEVTVQKPSGKNEDDVAELKKLIKEQQTLGTKLSTDWEDWRYDWENGRLIGIDWSDCGLKGEMSFSGFPYLRYLTSCTSNQLKKLDVGKCIMLTNFGCDDNQLKKIDISECTELEEFSCNRNAMKSIDISKCKKLKKMYCEENQLEDIDVSKNTALEYLVVSGNLLTEIDISKNKNLLGLFFANNQLTDIDVSTCPELVSLSCEKNKLTKIDVSKCPKLEDIHCPYNPLSELDLSGHSKLHRIVCMGSHLTKLNISGCTELWEIWCNENQLTSLDVSECTALSYLTCDKTVELIGVPNGCQVNADYKE